MATNSASEDSVSAGQRIPQQSILSLGAIRFIGLLGQSVADVSPAGAVAVLIGIVAAISGSGNWLSWLLAMPIFFAAAYCFSTIARQYTTTGGLPALIAKVSRPVFSLIIGALVLLFTLTYQAFGVIIFSVYLKGFLNEISISGTGWIYAVGGIIGTFGAALAAYRNIHFAATLLVVIEVIASVAILVLMVVVLIRHPGSIFDSSQFKLKGVSFHAVVLGAVLACLSFVSFECSTTFGQEAAHGKRTIPLALFGVLAYGTLLLVFASYVMTLGFKGVGGTTLATDPNPLDTLTRIYNVHWLSYPLTLSIVIALWGIGLALINWTARMIFTYGREGILPKSLGKADPRHKTPRNAILVILVLNVVVYFIFQAINRVSVAQYGYIVSSVTLFYVIAYVIAGLVSTYRGARQKHVGLIIAGLVTIVGFAYIAYNTVHPAPAYPQNVYDYVVLGVSAAVIVLGFVAWAIAPRWVARFASSVDADTALSEEADLAIAVSQSRHGGTGSPNQPSA